jgi:GT2 family glycosyltransferase
MDSVSFSVVLPCFNEADHIAGVIANVRSTEDYEPELVVVDNLSTDHSVAIARDKGATVLTNSTRQTISALRNQGAAACSGRVIAFLDADVLVAPDWLRHAAARYRAGFRGALGFVTAAPPDAGFLTRVWEERSLRSVRQPTPTDFLPARNLLVDRETFDALGGFDEALITVEDKDFTIRAAQAGYDVVCLPDSVVVHLGCDKTVREFVRKEFWRQSSTLRFARQRGFALRTLRNPALSLWHVAAFVLVLLSLATAIPFVAALAVWLLPSAVIAVRSERRTPRYVAPLMLMAFLRWNASGAALVHQLIKGDPFTARRRRE